MVIKSVRVFFTLNNSQYKRLKRIARRTAKYTGQKQPGDFLLSDYLQPESHLLIEHALAKMEADLEKMDARTYDPFADDNKTNQNRGAFL